MSDAHAILQRRLAAGEITKDEYLSLKEMLGGAEAGVAANSASNRNPAAGLATALSSLRNKGLLSWLVIAGVLIAGYSIYSGIVADRVQVLNLKSSGFFGDNISGTLYSEGNSGKVYVWVEMNGKTMCPRSTYLISKRMTPFQFKCSGMEVTGRFKVITNRSASDWIRNNATSL